MTLHLFEKSVELLKHKAAREYYDPLQVRTRVECPTQQCACGVWPPDHVLRERPQWRQAQFAPVVLHGILQAAPGQRALASAKWGFVCA